MLLCCYGRHFILTVPLSTQEYHQVLVFCYSNTTSAGWAVELVSYIVWRGVETHLMACATETGISPAEFIWIIESKFGVMEKIFFLRIKRLRKVKSWKNIRRILISVEWNSGVYFLYHNVRQYFSNRLRWGQQLEISHGKLGKGHGNSWNLKNSKEYESCFHWCGSLLA